MLIVMACATAPALFAAGSLPCQLSAVAISLYTAQAMRVDSLSQGRNQPFYHVLVDDRDGQYPGNVTYVAQENIVTIRGQTKVEHPLIDDYFRGFEDGRYIPTDKMRKQYPQRSESAEGEC